MDKNNQSKENSNSGESPEVSDFTSVSSNDEPSEKPTVNIHLNENDSKNNPNNELSNPMELSKEDLIRYFEGKLKENEEKNAAEFHTLKDVLASRETEIEKGMAINERLQSELRVKEEEHSDMMARSSVNHVEENRRMVQQLDAANAEVDAMRKMIEEIKNENKENEEKIIENMRREILVREEELRRISQAVDLTEKEKQEQIKSLNDNIKNIKDQSNAKIREMNSKLSEKQLELEEKESLMRGTNWDIDNINTVTNWIKECDKQAYVYEYSFEKVSNVYSHYTRAILIITSIQALISVSNLGLTEEDHPTPVWIIKILISVLATAAAILTQIT